MSADADVDGVDDLAAVDLVDAGNVGVGHDDLFEGGIVADVEGDFAQDGEDVVGVGAGVDAEVSEATEKSRERLETVAIWLLGMM